MRLSLSTTSSRRSCRTRCISGLSAGGVITVEVGEEGLSRASSTGTHTTHTLSVSARPPTSSHCLSSFSPKSCKLLSGDRYQYQIGQEWTRAKHKVDGYSTDRRTLTCLHAPVTLTYSHLQFSFRCSPSEKTSSVRLPKWRGDCKYSYSLQLPRCLPCLPIATNTQTNSHSH